MEGTERGVRIHDIWLDSSPSLSRTYGIGNFVDMMQFVSWSFDLPYMYKLPFDDAYAS